MTAFELIAAGVLLVPALVWTIIARHLWSYPPKDWSVRVMPLFAMVVALNNLIHVAWVLLRTTAYGGDAPALLFVTHEVSNVGIFALGRHMFRLMPLPEDPPGRAWLALNYGPAALVASIFVVSRLVPGMAPLQQEVAAAALNLCTFALGALMVWQLVRTARPGAWGPEAAGEVRRSDLQLVGWAAAAAVALSLVVAVLGGTAIARTFLEAGLFLAVAGPWIVRLLGVVVPEFLVTVIMLAATAAVFSAHRAAAPLVDARYGPLLDLGAVLTLGFVLASAPAALRAAVTHIVLRRSLRQQAELQVFLHTLSPEVGAAECCRRALAELVRVRQLRGAAILLRDGEAIVHGIFNVEPLLRVWPRGAAVDALPARPFGTVELRQLPLALREALVEANVGLGAAPIISPRRRWGHLFMNTGLLGGTYREDDFEAFETFVAQLALLLDGADLLARTVAVERSLAHAEKLAAVGELAARIAHEIRNPVTAARSLAQQLAREVGAPLGESARLILAELERVERQVAALLRFARREDFRFEAVDLGALVRETVEPFRSRLEAAGIGLDLDLTGSVTARVDPEKMRQVLVNLVENAIDAMSTSAGPRRLAVAVGGVNGMAMLRVADSGPGVPADALPHLFEPFFSLKENGTGLGLAIAKRTVDAHGGRIDVASRPGLGTTFSIELPLGGGA